MKATENRDDVKNYLFNVHVKCYNEGMDEELRFYSAKDAESDTESEKGESDDDNVAKIKADLTIFLFKKLLDEMQKNYSKTPKN